jgi:hypothetical protein
MCLLSVLLQLNVGDHTWIDWAILPSVVRGALTRCTKTSWAVPSLEV